MFFCKMVSFEKKGTVSAAFFTAEAALPKEADKKLAKLILLKAVNEGLKVKEVFDLHEYDSREKMEEAIAYLIRSCGKIPQFH